MTDRRRVLQMGALTALGAVALPACGRSQDAEPSPAPTPDPEQAEELALVAAYDAVLAAASRPEYQRIRDEHAAHLRALGWDADPAPTASPAETPGRRALRRAEASASRSRLRQAVAEPDAERAQILALIAASEAQHVQTLDGL